MKREEKNLISRQKILENATREFARQGYGLSSVNTICNTGAFPKGFFITISQTRMNCTSPACKTALTG